MNRKNHHTPESMIKRESAMGLLENSSRMSPKQKSPKAGGLPYARSLRAIGHSLDLIGVRCFELKKNGEEYQVRVIAGEPTSKGGVGNNLVKRVTQRILRRPYSEKAPSNNSEGAQPLRYTLSDIWQLDEDARSRRGHANSMPNAHKPSQVLRVVGAYMDRIAARAFTISMSTGSVSVWYENGVGARNWATFDMTNLYDRAIHMLLARSKKRDDLSSERKGSPPHHEF
jgi:hypothetical protein